MQETIAFIILGVAASWLVWRFMIPTSLKPTTGKKDCGPDCKCGD